MVVEIRRAYPWHSACRGIRGGDWHAAGACARGTSATTAVLRYGQGGHCRARNRGRGSGSGSGAQSFRLETVGQSSGEQLAVGLLLTDTTVRPLEMQARLICQVPQNGVNR